MAELIIELLCEEIPAAHQQRGAKKIGEILGKNLHAENITTVSMASYSTPRRLILHGTGLPSLRAETSEEKYGPRIDAPKQAIDGFLKANGLRSQDQCTQRETPKGRFWFAEITHPPLEIKNLLPSLLTATLKEMSWPNTMRFAGQSFRWIRPLRHICIVFDGETLEGEFETGEKPIFFRAGSQGHARFAPDFFQFQGDFAKFSKTLRANFVEPSPDIRKKHIKAGLDAIALKHNGAVIDDFTLLEETTGLGEWPTVLCGKIDPAFMGLPRLVISEVLRTHQKCFVFQNPEGVLLPLFAVIAEFPEHLDPAPILNGYERIIRARLSDAAFFLERDASISLEKHAEKLRDVIFHKKIGTLEERKQRLVRLARYLSPLIDKKIDPDMAERAAALCKADLTTLTVHEFPKLQGYIAAHYAKAQKENPAVIDAIKTHYAPPHLPVPKAPLSLLLALADKIDHLCTLWLAGEIPTGSKDPFALRRAALGILRLILENDLRLNLLPLFAYAIDLCPKPIQKDIKGRLLDFLADRLKIYLRTQNIRHDVIDSVFMLSRDDDFTRLVIHIHAVQEMMESEDGRDLLTAWRRCMNILSAEEKRDGKKITSPPDPALFCEPSETPFFTHLEEIRPKIEESLKNEHFPEAMKHMVKLCHPIDCFFNDVLINDPNPELRKNRLQLIAYFCTIMRSIAHFDAIEGGIPSNKDRQHNS